MKTSAQSIPLGFEVGTGKPIEIPVRNMCVTGQTQEAGKTTTLEALIARSGLRAITFLTKRGEGSFRSAKTVAPYFREQADWQFVASILEASRGEKLKFERAWIIRASKGARTLADVHRNVRTALETAKGLSADVYLTLDAYLEAVVPAIGSVRWASTLELAPGVNAVDLIGMPVELQHLVIRSSINWVLGREEHTVVVIPEAWKFVPEGRKTPVVDAVHALIRQGSGLKNYVWLDSQDIGGVDKETLRSVPVWLLGVQREANEIKRTLDNIPQSIGKPTKAAIATLGLGQFIACWQAHAITTYVQPHWMGSESAREVALGHTAPSLVPRKEPTVTPQEAQDLRDENTRLRRQVADLTTRLEALEKPHDVQESNRSAVRARTEEGSASARDRDGAARTQPPVAGDSRGSAGTAERPSSKTFTPEETFDNERLYQAFKARLIDEAPALLRALTSRPEVELTVKRRVIEMSDDNFRGRIARMLANGFYAAGATNSATRTELKRTGKDMDNRSIGRALDELTESGFLTRRGSEYVAVEGMKVNIVEAA
jgi:hypothetical protein